jgi:hypothetical protein
VKALAGTDGINIGLVAGIAIGVADESEEGTELGALFGFIGPAGMVADGNTLGLFAGAGNLVA